LLHRNIVGRGFIPLALMDGRNTKPLQIRGMVSPTVHGF
jgi:hypothetical protein